MLAYALVVTMGLLDASTVVTASIPVPTHGMIAYMGAFSGGSIVEFLSNDRFYNVVQFAIEVSIILPCYLLSSSKTTNRDSALDVISCRTLLHLAC